MIKVTAVVLTALVLSGCATSQVSVVPVAATAAATANVKTIAMAPDGGLLADAVAVELSNRGYTVIDGAATSRMMVRLNLNEVEIATPVGLAKFKEQGIDAFLSVRSAGGYDEQPQSASARLNSTATGQILSGVTWQNGWGGEAGSMADRVMRKGLAQSAKEIVDGLAANLR
jgi:hypothetical protein